MTASRPSRRRSRRPAPAAARLTGAKIRSGLKIVTTRSTMSRNLAPSLTKRIFDLPTRGRASIGSNATL